MVLFAHKKGALELSITAIVVLIIAIVLLGLAIGFIRNLFGQGQSLVQSQFTSIKDDLRKQLSQGGELLVYSVPEKVSVGQPAEIGIGVHNTLANLIKARDGVCFRLEVRCIQPFTPGAQCVNDVMGPVVVGGYDFTNNLFVQINQPNHNWFTQLNSQFNIKDYGDEYDAGVIQVRNVKPDSYSMEINVLKAKEEKSCSDAGNDFEPYTSKTFNLKVASS